MDELIARYSVELQLIYDKQTAGDHTFSGVLGEFLREVDLKRSIPHSKLCQQLGHGLATLGTPEACRALETTTIFEI